MTLHSLGLYAGGALLAAVPGLFVWLLNVGRSGYRPYTALLVCGELWAGWSPARRIVCVAAPFAGMVAFELLWDGIAFARGAQLHAPSLFSLAMLAGVGIGSLLGGPVAVVGRALQREMRRARAN